MPIRVDRPVRLEVLLAFQGLFNRINFIRVDPLWRVPSDALHAVGEAQNVALVPDAHPLDCVKRDLLNLNVLGCGLMVRQGHRQKRAFSCRLKLEGHVVAPFSGLFLGGIGNFGSERDFLRVFVQILRGVGFPGGGDSDPAVVRVGEPEASSEHLNCYFLREIDHPEGVRVAEHDEFVAWHGGFSGLVLLAAFVDDAQHGVDRLQNWDCVSEKAGEVRHSLHERESRSF